MSQEADDRRPLIAHVVFRFDVGGLENGVVNLLNRLPSEAYRHVIIALTDITDFRKRIARHDVQFIALEKAPGHTFWVYPRLYRLFRELRPAIVHSRNLAALEVVIPAWLSGVAVRIHGEHGRDVGDLDGSSRKYRWVRRFYRPFVTKYIALSRDLEDYLITAVGVPRGKIEQIYNGVDIMRFHPVASRQVPAGCPFVEPGLWLVGSVGRMQVVKNQTDLARAFIRILQAHPELVARLRLVIVGAGPLRAEAQALLAQAGVADYAWLPGARDDVPEIMRGLDCFVLPSLAEGISNTILEAMASGLPVVATDVGGNRELIDHGRTGEIVPAGNVEAMAERIAAYAADPQAARAAGLAGRALVERQFSMQAMCASYLAVYDGQLRAQTGRHRPPFTTSES
ncbi:MAG TPA: TIGR03088 family PEP-CTERM/XrtA system glycosyltransferase [Accumulibacter sp.]|uniref:TIGR03088 family PEP-CTERM/XrtA system glycosyltransferase n=1 Tax=Accumulibacter sp. TaxID=2053492 RepID=UPI0028790746|nr:TIGR03088 family PEP-CTERM/XrtA system glycosyltransferase [Accumulibacter sp.]MDS4056020.1 TIGR03088 family PEP-CTERM/XrtA system glycosyltransferase [Accumulibacter sp.]HMV04076.1 TIGR03088 family PEP-CTERM/XrtA system glycosyltransferase [Accumulibacter sp.]HMW63563.1 TIGR03088 family PEP-CTERM/XrtA system glycosyltransferase [Accumulibacter sp.]HMW78919.1 TIGR03088 family PEP-CTERM/XrtA system glycosyltransferase [Accumulibacter sp.]HMX68245.1 TIGR03088 family PEP-CTERM/XrtA system glyc